MVVKILRAGKQITNLQGGFSIVEMLVTAVVLTVLFLGLSALFMLQKRTETKFESLSWLDQLRREIVSTVKNPVAWRNTFRDPKNETLRCLREMELQSDQKDKIYCKDNIGNPVSGDINIIRGVLQAAPNNSDFEKAPVLLETLDQDSGFTLKGIPCKGFLCSDTNCNLRYVVSWRAICVDSEKCQQPDVEIHGMLLISDKNKPSRPINPALYGMTIRLTKQRGSKASCEEFGLGVWNANTKKCEFGPHKTCNEGSYAIGFYSDGTPICDQVDLPKCPKGMFLNGIGFDGAPKCIDPVNFANRGDCEIKK